eukprot:6179085-Pleurochrysis_carterae.AAC.1
MHLSAAHLEELIVRQGMLERSDDKILERDSRTAKRIKSDLIFFGGSGNPSKSAVGRVEFKPEKDAEGNETGILEEVESIRKRVAGQGEQFARLMLGRKALLAQRKKRLSKSSTLQLAQYKHEVKKEERGVVRDHLNELYNV